MSIRAMVVSAILFGMYAFAGPGFAQAPQGPPPGQPPREGQAPPRQGGERGRFDPEQMRQRFMDSIKENLKASDKEWELLKVPLEEVMKLAREARGGIRFFGRGRPEGRTDMPQTEVEKAAQDLRATLEKKDATPDEIKAKVQALRDARAKAKKELEASQQALRELVTPWQEAQLVLMGILE